MTTRLSRRGFLTRSGALVVSFSMAPLLEPLASGQGRFDTHMSHIDPASLDSWIAVGVKGIVTAYTGKCDFGQGIYTAQTQLVAEELCVPIEHVHLIQCDTSGTPDQGTTSGSQSTPTNFNHSGLAQAAATAREALIKMAAQRLGIPASQLTAAKDSSARNSGVGSAIENSWRVRGSISLSMRPPCAGLRTSGRC
jgi:CO/xanthine dehydrogenase Mo-binding subunit